MFLAGERPAWRDARVGISQNHDDRGGKVFAFQNAVRARERAAFVRWTAPHACVCADF
jgi:hypothetical protein